LQFKKLTDFTDTAQLTKLLHNAYAADINLGIHFAAASITKKKVQEHIASTPTFVLQKEDDTIVATTSVRLPWSDNPGPFPLPHLGWVATNPDCQHQGLAKQIITQVITNFVKDELHAPAVSLGTAVEHPWLQDFYHSLGFQTIDIVRKFKDHQTAYLINIFDERRTRQIDDIYLKEILSQTISNGR